MRDPGAGQDAELAISLPAEDARGGVESLIARIEQLAPTSDHDDLLIEERAISDLLHDLIVCGPDEFKVIQPPIYTRSVDAAMALAERLIPAWFAFYLTQEWSGGATRKWPSVSAQNRVTISRNKDSYVNVEGEGYTLAAAVVAATLRAYQQEARGDRPSA